MAWLCSSPSEFQVLEAGDGFDSEAMGASPAAFRFGAIVALIAGRRINDETLCRRMCSSSGDSFAQGDG